MLYPKHNWIMNMRLSIIAYVIFIFAKPTESHKPKCDGIHVDGKYHKKELIANGINRPYQLSIYNNEHKIFFSYNIGNDDEDKFEIGYLKKDQRIPTPINGTKNGFATAVDEKNKVAYFGGSHGIYVDDLSRFGPVELIIKDHNIWDMFFKHHLYYIDYPSHRLHKVIANKSEVQDHITEKIYQFVIDGDNDTFITTKDGLHEIKSGTNHSISYDGPKVFRAIEVNHAGVAHFCGQNAIYTANKKNHTLVEIAQIKNIFGLTFDKDDKIIYSNPHEIVKLLPEDCKQ